MTIVYWTSIKYRKYRFLQWMNLIAEAVSMIPGCGKKFELQGIQATE